MAKGRERRVGPAAKQYILGGIMLLATVLLVLLTRICSDHFQEIYDQPPLNDGYIDMFVGNDMMVPLPGEAEFFYGKWIVTDGMQDAEPDGMLAMTDTWKGKDFGGGALPSEGYASYRFTMRVASEEPFIVYCTNFIGAYRVYVNGTLNVAYGRMSRDVAGTASSGLPEEYHGYTPFSGETVTVVIELSATDKGGLTSSFCYMWGGDDRFEYVIHYGREFAFGVLGALGAMFLVSFIMSAGLYRKDREYTLTLLLGGLVLLDIFSLDIFRFLVTASGTMIYNIVPDLFYASAVVTSLFFVLYVYKTGILVPTEKTAARKAAETAFGAVFNAGCIAAFYALDDFSYKIIPVFLQMLYFALLYFPLFKAALGGRKYVVPYIIVLFAVLFITGIGLMDMLDFVTLGTESVASWSFLVLATGIFLLYMLQIRDKNLAVLREEEIRRKLVEMRGISLREQIKPHFVFNCLTGIQATYHHDIAEGDRALGNFSRYLRYSIDAGEHDLVPFETELKNVLNYAELESTRRGRDIELMLDIEFWDFSVPPLSLQPLVENAVKHSGALDMEDGWIQLAVVREGNEVKISLKDNGCGFDTEKIGRGSVGLANVRERFELLLGARLDIRSAPGEGTTASVTIPLGETGEKDERD